MTDVDFSIAFNKNAVAEQNESEFFALLTRRFGEDAAYQVHEIFENLQLVVPESRIEFMNGRLGMGLPMDKSCIILKIEPADYIGFSEKEAHEHPRLLQPITSILTGKIVVQLWPGVHQAHDISEEKELVTSLEADGIEFWDDKFSNIGRLPFKTELFPNGVTVVTDHHAVCTQRFGILEETQSLAEARQAQEELYAPLRQAFQDAWPDFSAPPDAAKMKAFWDLCRAHAKAGKLVAGWHEDQSEAMKNEDPFWGDNSNTNKASDAARGYARKAFRP